MKLNSERQPIYPASPSLKQSGKNSIMKDIIVTVNHACGLHARPAADLMTLAKMQKCKVRIQFNDQQVNAKSLLEILSLGVNQGDQIRLVCEGEEEEEAIRRIADFFCG